MASIISAGTSSGTALNLTGDTSGVLQLASNNGTVGVTLDTSQNVGIGTSGPSFSGGSRRALTLNSPAGQLSILEFGVNGSLTGYLFSNGSQTTLNSQGATFLNFETNGTERMRIDSSGNVGIGVSSPAVKLHVSTSADEAIRMQSTGSPFISFYSGATRRGYIQTASDSFALAANIAIPMTFITNDTERMRVNAGAPVLCLAGGNTSATGTGIAFPATQSASSDANTLDDYEEGTFTPNIAGLSAAGTATYSERYGKYTKVGNRCNFQMWVNWSNLTGATGALVVTGLPFTSVGATGAYANASVYMDTAITLSANCVIQGYVLPSNTIFYFSQYATGGSNNSTVAIDTAGAVMITGSYEVA